jgi:predicted DsbA family dithiol-disulfide isomerase
MKIDFVSDVSCPWCIIGLNALEQAIERLGDDVDVALHFQPFELNPQMPADGQELYEHMQQKYGSTKEQSDAAREMIRARGEELGFTFRMDRLQRIYNTFDTHRLLHWAALEGRQAELKRALFSAYFTDGENPGDREVLLRAAAHVGLDTAAAAAVLDSDRYAGDVRAQQAYYHQHGIHAVPAVVINDRHLIQGGQPVEVFEQALREIAAEAAGDDPAQP